MSDYDNRMATYGVSPREEVATAAADTAAVWLDVRSIAEQEQTPLPKVRAKRVQTQRCLASWLPGG
jgi:hypothetical protein